MLIPTQGAATLSFISIPNCTVRLTSASGKSVAHALQCLQTIAIPTPRQEIPLIDGDTATRYEPLCAGPVENGASPTATIAVEIT